MQQKKEEFADFSSIYHNLKNIIQEVVSTNEIIEENPQTESQLLYHDSQIEIIIEKQIICNERPKNIQTIFNEILHISHQSLLVIHAFQCADHQLYIYQTLFDGLQIKHIPPIHLILEQKETDTVQESIKVSALMIFQAEGIGFLLGTNQGQIIRFYQSTSKTQYLAGTSIIEIKRMNEDFQGVKIKHLCAVGFEDHQINIYDYNSCFNVRVFKEGFNIPVQQKFLRTHIKNCFILSAAEEGTVTFWSITPQIIQQLKNGKEENYLNHSNYPIFDVVPLTKICDVHKTTLKFIEFLGQLIVSIEEDGTFRIWYMEHAMKQFVTIWKFKIQENILKFGLNESNQELYMSNEKKIFMMRIPTIENEDFQCEVFENINQAKDIVIDLNSNLLSWIQTNQEVEINSGVSVFKFQQVELDQNFSTNN